MLNKYSLFFSTFRKTFLFGVIGLLGFSPLKAEVVVIKSFGHSSKGLFEGISNPLVATRYHSLIADKSSLPECLEVTAWLEDGTIMGLQHRDIPNLYGVQFHPESVLTQSGHHLLSNFLGLAEANN